jgi:hypothetical protein
MTLRSIAKRGGTLVASEPAQADQPLKEKYTAIHNQAAIQAEATVVDLGVDGARRATRINKALVQVHGALKVARMEETVLGRHYERTDRNEKKFVERFPWAVELPAKPREQAWKILLPVLCAFGVSFALDYPVMELIAPNVTAAAFPVPISWLLENFALVGAICVAVAEAAMVAYAGREAAWAWSPLHGDSKELRENGEHGSRGLVFSERGRSGNRASFILLALTLLGLLVALVALREKALTLLGGLDAGVGATGLAGHLAEATPGPGGTSGAVELLVISGFPLLVAGWAAYLRESPLATSLADLVNANRRALGNLVSATKTRIALEDRLVELGKDLGLVNVECVADQFLSRLFPHMVAEVLTEASPEFYGVVSTKPHPLLWKIEDTAAPVSVEKLLADSLAKRQAAGTASKGSENGDGRHEELA